MITITKYVEQLNKNSKPANHSFEFTYQNAEGKFKQAQISFSNKEFEKKKATPNTPLVDYFKQVVTEKFDLLQSEVVEKETMFLNPEDIKTKLGTDTIET